MKVATASFLLATLLSGCATTPWHENLMTNQQLAAADCAALKVEQKRVEENAAHLREAAGTGTGSVVLLSILDSMAQSKGAANTGGAGAMQAAEQADQHKAQAVRMDQRSAIISQLRVRRNCA